MASIAQAAGVDAVGLINLTVAAARNATTHRRNCDRLASHVRMIGNLLEKLQPTGLRSFPATGEPLDLLEEALGKALELVESCREKSYLYMLALGWSVVYRFRLVQKEIDRYLKLVPLISLVHEYRMQVCSVESLSALLGIWISGLDIRKVKGIIVNLSHNYTCQNTISNEISR